MIGATRAARDLDRRTEGAVLVTGLFASAFLIGVLWYLLGVGDAIVYRERMQDGADAVAFAPAVLHARGMNLIALLNLTMAALLAIFVAAKIVQALLLIANILSCAVCAASFGSYGCDDCSYLSENEQPYEDFVKKVDKTVSDFNRTLHDTADTVAKEMPYLAARRGVSAGGDYARMVEGSFSASVSLVPGDLESGDLGGGPNSGGGNSGGGTRLGLPVEDDEFENLCNHSGTLREIVFVPTILHYNDGQQLVVTIVEWAGAFVEGFIRRNPNAWCGGGGGSSGMIGGSGVSQNGSTCLTGSRRHRRQNRACLSGLAAGFGGLGSRSSVGSDKKASKRIYGPAQHGDDYFATWGFTESHFVESNVRGEKGSKIATWGKTPEGTDLSPDALDRHLRTMQVAKSEFYYDPRRGGPRGWGEIKDEALWNLRWRARLRRVSQPNPALAGAFSGAGLASIVIANAGSRADIPGIVTNVLAMPPDALAAWSAEHVGPPGLGRRTGGIVH
jgi:hypothetical protein